MSFHTSTGAVGMTFESYNMSKDMVGSVMKNREYSTSQ